MDVENLKCAFSNTLVSGRNHCEFATQVVRRGGVEADCTDGHANRRCKSLLAFFKSIALPKFGYEDNLLVVPHGVIQKIQYGGLLALQELLSEESGSESVSDISSLTQQAQNNYGDLSQLPCDTLVARMMEYKLRKRR